MTENCIVTLSDETLESYFAGIVQQAVAERRVIVTDEVQFYMVRLLCEFMLSDRLYRLDADSGHRERDALALLLARAESAPVDERVRLLKRLGDSSLYISGFFGESLARSLVDVEYYISMGGTAYGQLSEVLRLRRFVGATATVFAELAEKFRQLVEVLARVSLQSDGSAPSNESLLRLYDLWLRTGSRRVAEKLRAHGLDPNAAVKNPDGDQ
ncbi:MAG: hypothetical protein JXR83_10745 [Deltaproteobacteria bacterium]|nr:hypothetical protein [Deltaproteobacteria bacterium]